MFVAVFFLWKKNVMSEKIEFKFFFFFSFPNCLRILVENKQKVRIIYEMGKKMFGFFVVVDFF